MQKPTLQTVSFFGTCPASQNITLVSKRITSKFKTKYIRAAFPPGVNRLMTLRYFISPDEAAPTTTRPNGIDLLGSIGQVNYITGDDTIVELPHEIYYENVGAWLKVYAENTDTFDHTIESQVTIEFLPDEEVEA